MLENFKNECKNDAYNNRLGKVVYDDIKEITHNDNLASLELTEDCYVNGNIIGTTNTKSIKINTIGKPNVFNGELENGSIDKDGQNGVSPELDTTTYIELKEKLNSINDVADEHDVISGKGIKRIGEYVFTGDEDLKYSSGNDSQGNLFQRCYFQVENMKTALSGRQEIKSNYFKYKPNIGNIQNNDSGQCFIAERGNIYFYLPHEYDSADKYKEWLKAKYDEGNPVIFKWILETPEEITTEPVNIQLRKGYNKIEINDKNGLLNKTKLNYLADTEKTVEGTNQIIIDDAEPVNARSLIVYGNSFQDTRSGKNLYNYKDTITVDDGITADDDGWITCNINNSSGSSIIFPRYFTHNLNVTTGKKNIVVLEVKSVEGTGSIYVAGNGQFKERINYDFSNLENNKTYVNTITEKENYDNDEGLRTYIRYDIGQSGSITFRISVLEDTSITPEQFIYEPYGAMPSPEFPSEIKCVQGNLQLVDTGKNMFDINNPLALKYGFGSSSSAGTINSDGTITTSRNLSSSRAKGTPVELEKNTDYIISIFVNSIETTGLVRGCIELLAYNNDDSYNSIINALAFTDIGKTISLEVNSGDYEKYAVHISGYFGSGNSGTLIYSQPMVRKADTNDVYEPYIPNKVRNTEKFAIEKSTYTIDLNGATDVYLFFYDENDNFINKSGYHKLPYTFNNIDAKYVRFMFKNVNNDFLDVNDITDIQINDKFSLYGKDVDVNVGVKYDDDSEEYIELGKYTIDKPNDEETVNLGEYKGYDYLDKLNDNYVCSFKSFANITVKDIYSDLCEQVGLTPETLDFENNDIPVTGNIFEEGYTRKGVLSDIAELASSFACVNKENNQCCLKTLGKEPVEVISKDDYSLLTKNQQYGPLNCLVIKDSQFEGENVSIQDDDSINENGETQYAIIDNIFLYTPELREQAINKIWESIKGLTYYDCKIESYHGLPYLNAGDKITVEDDNGNYFDTYVLKHTFTYDGTYKSVIESPALTKQETNIKSDVSLKDKLRKTYANVKKAENKIELLTTEVNNNSEKTAGIEITLDGVKQEVDNLSDQSETIVKLQTDVEGIKAQIGSITDVTVNANGIGSITLNDVLTSELLYLQVYPTSEDLSYLNLSPKTYLSNNTKITSRDLLFINTKTNETTKYTLPCNLYYISDDVKDELIIDYDNKQLMVTHRVGINAETGEKYALSKPTTKLYDYKGIDLIEGNYTIKMQSFNTAYINARALANSIYTAQYATKVEVNNAIKLSEDGIKQEVNGKITLLDGTVKNLSGLLELKLNTKDLCTELNGSADKITFKGNRFSWQSTYSSMSETGTLKATNVDLTGKITASSGTIGGFTITSNSIYKGSNALGTSGSGNIYLGTNGLSISNTFKVTNTGVLTASGATISGTITTSNITATGGTIGGFKLTSSSIYRGSSSFGTSGSGNIYIGTSGISISNAFKVSNAGKLTATNVDLSGKITATSGSFTGTITTTNITATGGKIGGASLNNYGIYFNNGSTGWGLWGTTAHANIVFHAGANSTNIGGAPFRVMHDGTVYASKINVTNGSITGGTVAGFNVADNRLYYGNTVINRNGNVEFRNDNGYFSIGSGAVLLNGSGKEQPLVLSDMLANDEKGDVNSSVELRGFFGNVRIRSNYYAIIEGGKGTFVAGQNYGSASTRATKDNLQILSKEKSNEIYNIVKKLQFYQYDYKEKYGGQKNNIGFLIDDIENTLLNDYLHIRKREDDKDFRNYNCEDLTRIILMIVQKLQNKIEKLESKN